MMRGTPPTDANTKWHDDLFERLQIFENNWKNFRGTEQAGAQDFLRALLDIYDVRYTPGTVFEQHPVRVPARGKVSQRDLFGEPIGPTFTTERMDMYLPRVCVWEMKSSGEHDLQKHHEQLLGYWARMRPRYMVLCNFHEFWIYDTNDEDGQLQPKVKFSLRRALSTNASNAPTWRPSASSTMPSM